MSSKTIRGSNGKTGNSGRPLTERTSSSMKSRNAQNAFDVLLISFLSLALDYTQIGILPILCADLVPTLAAPVAGAHHCSADKRLGTGPQPATEQPII